MQAKIDNKKPEKKGKINEGKIVSNKRKSPFAQADSSNRGDNREGREGREGESERTFEGCKLQKTTGGDSTYVLLGAGGEGMGGEEMMTGGAGAVEGGEEGGARMSGSVGAGGFIINVTITGYILHMIISRLHIVHDECPHTYLGSGFVPPFSGFCTPQLKQTKGGQRPMELEAGIKSGDCIYS